MDLDEENDEMPIMNDSDTLHPWLYFSKQTQIIWRFPKTSPLLPLPCRGLSTVSDNASSEVKDSFGPAQRRLEVSEKLPVHVCILLTFCH